MTEAETGEALRVAYARAVVPDGPPALAAAYAHVPRERFLGPGPWQLSIPNGPIGYTPTPDTSLEHIYRDVAIALEPTKLLNNGQPSAHAKWIAAAAPAPGDSVLHVGCGTGYFTAIFAELVGATGRVIALDVEPELIARARANLAPWPQVEVHESNGSDPRGDHDVIYVNAGATHARREWLDALRPNGRLIIPLTAHVPPYPLGVGFMMAIERRGEPWPARIVTKVGIYDCVDAREPTEEPQIRSMLRAHGGELVLVRTPHDAGPACRIHAADSCIQALLVG